MKFKKIITCLMLCLLSFTGIFFGCKDRYANFKIEINGESSINLVMNSADDESEKEVLIKISNAPSKTSKNISYEVSKANIVKVEKLTSEDENMARFKISALENITSYNPSCVITFKTAEGNKTCTLNVNVEIPIQNFNINKDYTPYVVTGGEDYYINTANLIVFEPQNTTQRDVTYTLKDISLIDKYGLTLTENGKVSILNYVDDSKTALPNFDVIVKSVQDPTKEKEITVNVFKEIVAEDILVAYDYIEQTTNAFNSSENKFTGEEGLSLLSTEGITFASNINTKKDASFGIFLNNGLDFEKVKVEFEKTILNNAIIEEDNFNNTSKLLNQYKIYSVNPNVDILVVKLSYIGIEEYSFTINIPISVLEYPTNLLVNSTDKVNYNIFDYYEGNSKGQEFNIDVLQAGSYDRRFKVAISETAFSNLEIRFDNELLDYSSLVSTVFESDSTIYIKAKNLTSTVNDIQITFYSNILENSTSSVEEELVGLVKTINLTLTPGIKMLNYFGVFEKSDILYLQTNKNIDDNNTLALEFVINGQEGDLSLNEYALVDITSGANLVEVTKSIDSNAFIFKSKDKTGVVKVKLYTENGLTLEEKSIYLYNYYDHLNETEKLVIDTSSNNLKVVKTTENDGEKIVEVNNYYLGLAVGQNTATIKVLNSQNATIYSAKIESSNPQTINANLVSLDDLTFYLQALKETESKVTITITLTLFNENEFANTNTFKTETLVLDNLYTYNPIESIEKTQKQIVVIDGDNLDVDSLKKGLNVLDVEKYLKIVKADNDLSTLRVEYIMPSALIKGTDNVVGDYELITEYIDEEQKIEKPFKKIAFHAGKNHEFDANGEYTFSFTIRIEDLVGSGEYHLVTLKVVLQKHIKPDGIKILNEHGYVYLTNNQSFGQIDAKVYSDTLKEVTNPSLTYEIVSGNSVEIDENGFITVKASGITEVLIKAKASQYIEGGTYSATKPIYVVVADGSKSYPYIYSGNFVNGKFYTLLNDIDVNNPIAFVNGGVNGNFVYSDYTTLNNKNAVYNLIYSGETSLFGEELNTELKNLNIVLNSTSANVTGEFGYIAKINNTKISNVNLITSQTTLNLSGKNGYNVGLMFGNNAGEIENCSVGGKIILNAEDSLAYNFGGLVGVNNGKVISDYNYAKKSQITDYASTLNISANSKNATIGGVVGVNAKTISNISAKAVISSNSLIVGGIVGEFVTGTVGDIVGDADVHNLLFKGNAYSSNTNSLVGGIAGKVSSDVEFKLLVTEFVNINKTSFGANLKGATVGGLFAEAVGATEIKIGYSFVNSLVSFDNYFDLEGEKVGGLIANATKVNLTAVYTSISINGTNAGAFINTASGIQVTDGYSFATGAEALIAGGNDITVNKTYSTNSNYVVNEVETPSGSYTAHNYIDVLNDNKFKTGNWTVNTSLNKGLPYLVYNDGTNYINLITIVPNSINANFVTGNVIENNYSYGVDKNIIVVSENNESIRAIIYKAEKLSYNINDLLNITTIPANSDKSNIILTSSNTNVISISGSKINILNTGDVTINISYLQNLSVNVHISVVEKIQEFRIDNLENFKILKNNTKLFNTNITATENVGLYFGFGNDVKDAVYYNNYVIKNSEIYSYDNIHIFKGIQNVETKVKVIPFYTVKFDGVEHKVLDYDFKKEINFSVVEGATSIYSEHRSLEFVEGETIDFEIVVKSSNHNEILNLEIDNSFDNVVETIKIVGSQDEYNSDDFTIKVKKDVKENDLTFNFTISYDKSSEKLASDKLFILKISPETRKDLSVEIDLLVKSSKLINVELNHYSSTSHYYDDYNSIIMPSSLPNSKIVAGNLGVLNINLYPSYASLDKIEVISSVVGTNKINFAQLAYKQVGDKTENMVVVSNAETFSSGISLNLGRSILLENGNFEFNGNLYVSTLLPTNVDEDTIFTITVICYFNNLLDSKEYKIDLTAKPLTSIKLESTKDSGLYLARGSELKLKARLINFETYQEITLENFDWEVVSSFIITEDTEIPEIVDITNKGTQENPDYRLTIKTDILTPSGLEFKITPKFTTLVDGNEITSYSNSIIIKVVDFVVNSIEVENAESGILDNNLGNVSVLKAVLNVTKCTETFTQGSDEALALSNINVNINTLENLISKSNSIFNLVTRNTTGNEIYTGIVEGGNYSNFTVGSNNDGYLELKGKVISTSNLILKANISYEGGKVQLNTNSNIEFRTPFVFNVKTYSSDDNPLPIKSYQDFIDMEEGEDYILLNDIEIPADFTGISANISSFDGNNKTINLNGFTISDTSVTSLGLFNNVSEDTVIKNVTVNILPTLFYSGDTYYYGLNINAQSLSALNFGVIAGTNAGVVTNCKVINNNLRIINNENQYKEVVINVLASENIELNIAGLVGVNNGFITNSKVGSTTSSNAIKILANANLAGLVSENNNKIASSFVVNATLINNSKTKITGGFVAKNSENASIITSYIEGYVKDRTQKIGNAIIDGGIFATNSVGGFVHTNSGNIKDCYSNIKVTTNKRSAGFVYDNTAGFVETSFSASTGGIENAQSFKAFTGNNEENIVLNNKGIVNCYYFGANLEGDDDDEYLEPANGISVIDDASMFEGFINDNTSSSVWVFKEDCMPSLFDANLNITSERELIENTNSATADVYNYIYINNIIGSSNNPIIVSTSQELLNALTKSNNLYSYYFNGRIVNTNINYNNIQIIRDIDLSTIIDANNNKLNSTTEVQKLQDIIFAGNLNGNGMNISNVTITAKNNVTNYTSFGLFKQIGVEMTYNTQGNIYNSNLDEDNCTVIKNLNFDINSISATLTRSVGTLAGEVINSKLYNININSQNNLTVTGANMVGAVSGRISGNSFVKGVHTNLSVQATYDNQSGDYTYKTANAKKIYRYAYDVVTDELNNKVNFAGGLFGVVDIYKTVVTNYAQQSDGKSYYITANIVRENILSEENAHIQFVSTTGDIKIIGDVVGGLFGYVGAGAVIYDAKFILLDTNTQNLIADYAVGGIAGENSGYITYATVEHEEELQIEIDKDEKISASSIFANENNKALIVGGLVGMLKNGRLTNSYSKANINAKNSLYVGAIVGQFVNSKLHHVYAVSEVIAQSEEISSSGLVLTNKGYGALIGVVSSVDSSSTLNSIVFITKNKTNPLDFNLSGLIGYNNTTNLKVEGISETSSEQLGLNLYYGNSLDLENVNTYSYEFYLNKDSGRFSSYNNSDSWYVPLTLDRETYPILVYNKLGTTTSLNTEDDLRNMLDGGNYTLTSDIFLSEPWEPMSFKGGTFVSSRRATEEEIEVRGEYYKIYNLNINNQISSAGFFSNTSGSTIENVNFVVGTTYQDYSSEQYRLLPEASFEDDVNWNKYTRGGIQVINNSLNSSSFTKPLSLAVVTGYDEGSTFKNLIVEFKNDARIETNLQNVGAIVGYGNGSSIIGCTVKDAKIIQNATALSVDLKNAEERNSQKIGAIIGAGTNIKQFNGNTVKNANITISGGDYNNAYLGFVAGEIFVGNNENADMKNISILGESNVITNNGGKNVYIGALAGNISHYKTITSINLKNTKLNITTSKSLNAIYVGGLFGKAKLNILQNISIDSTNSIVLSTATSETGKNNTYIGGVIGYSLGVNNGKNTISNLICNNSIEAQVRSLVIANSTSKYASNTNIGGIIGQNGDKKLQDSNNEGVKLHNIISRVYLDVKEANSTNVEQNIGGIIGTNWKNAMTNVYNLGKARLIIPSFNNVGALIGYNISAKDGYANASSEYNTQEENCYFVEDLNQMPARRIEFGLAISYSEFTNNITTNKDDNFSKILTSIYINILNLETLSTSVTQLIEDVNYNGEELEYTLGSVYNPIVVTSMEILSNEESTENTYFILNEDVKFKSENIENLYIVSKTYNSAQNVFVGNLIGNGHTITLNKTFAYSISKKSLISSIVFKITGETISVNNICYVKSFNTIIAKENNGTIYNVATTGKMYVEFSSNNLAPIVLKNSGYICNTISNNDILIETTRNGSNASVAGFVCSNDATIYNCISSGNIEVFVSENGYKVDAINETINNLAGFVYSNKTFITNVVSATTLPVKLSASIEYNFDIINIENGITVNNFVDFFSNGDYKATGASVASGAYIEEYDNYLETSKLINKINNGLFKTNWAQSLGVLYGYNYPQLSIYSNSQDFLKENLSTIENGEYLVNNFGVFNYTLDTLLTDIETLNISMKQIRSFKGSVKGYYMASVGGFTQEHLRYYYTTKEITKSFSYNGNGFVIVELVSNAKIIKENEKTSIYAGLFYNTSSTYAVGDTSENVVISISNLAITDAEFNTQKVITNATEDETLNGDVYLGAIIASSIAQASVTGCYIDGVLTINNAKGENLIVGGLIGNINNPEGVKSVISNNVSNVQITLKNLKYSSSTKGATNTSAKVTFAGFNSIVGGIVGKVNNAQVSNNFAFKDILVSTSLSLNLGGIIGEIENGTLKNNLTISKPAYNGAYLSYYSSSDSEDLTYNVNAVVGKMGETVDCLDNMYNSSISFVSDKNINSETLSSTLFTTLKDAYLNEDNNLFMKSGPSQMVEMPNIIQVGKDNLLDGVLSKKDSVYTLSVQNNAIYIVELNKGSEVAFDLEQIKVTNKQTYVDTYELENTTIIFSENVVVYAGETRKNQPIFDNITNSTIANVEIRSKITLTNAALAKVIDNTQLYNIKLNDIYLNHEGYIVSGGNSDMGMLANRATNSYLTKIAINKGRLQVVSDKGSRNRIGAVLGYAENTLIQESSNDATITVYNNLNKTHVAGILGYGRASSIFKATNNGLIYAKSENCDGYTVSGIANMDNANECTISFSTNYAKVKGVNKTMSGGETKNLISGIGSKATILYSINNAQIMSISLATISVSNGIGGSSNVYYSYNAGNIISNNEIYAITINNAYVCFNIGNGYTDNSVEIEPSNGGKYNYNLTEISTHQMTNGNFKDLFKEEFIDDATTGVNSHYIIGSYDIYAYNAGLENNAQWLVCIRAIEEEFELHLETNANGEIINGENGKPTYLIATSFELWFWAYFGDKSYNVKLEADIDLRSFSWPQSINFSGTFDGQNRTIKNLLFTANSSTVGFVRVNDGTIKNINFENPKYTLTQTSDSEITGGAFNIAIIATTNNGLIENIMISSTNGERFVDVNMQGNSAKTDINVTIGLAAAINNGTIKNVEVICIDNYAISSTIDLTGSSELNNRSNVIVKIGGLVGVNKQPERGVISYGKIEQCTFIATISSYLVNRTLWGNLADNDIVRPMIESAAAKFGMDTQTACNLVNELLFAFFAKAHQDVGKIVAEGSYGINNCYAPTSEGEDKFLIAYNENGMNKGATGDQSLLTSNLMLMNGRGLLKAGAIATATAVKKLKPFVKVASKADNVVDAAKGFKKFLQYIKTGLKGMKMSNWAFLIASTAYETAQTINNNASYHFAVNDKNYLPANQEAGKVGYTNYDFDSPYVKLFSTGFAANTTIYNNFKNYFSSNEDEEVFNFPLNASFLNLSGLKEKLITANNTYNVYNAQQLAYALTQDNNYRIEFMDHIDLSNRIWDDGLILAGTHNIINNGFKALLGLNKDKEALKETLGVENYVLEVDTKYVSKQEPNVDLNEYGYFDDVSENKTETAFNNFETRFKVAYNGNTENAIKEENGKKYYYVNNEKQIEVISDALNTYTYGDNLIHVGIDLSGLNFVIERDLDLSNTNVSAIDSYNYKFAYRVGDEIYGKTLEEFEKLSNDDTEYKFVVQIVSKDSNGNLFTTEETMTKADMLAANANDQIESFSLKYLLPDFIEATGTDKVLTPSSNVAEYKTFNANIIGKFNYSTNKYPTITLNKNNSLLTSLNLNSSVKNLTIKPVSNSVNLTKSGTTTFGFVANYNYGAIESVTLDASSIASNGEGILEIIYDVYYSTLKSISYGEEGAKRSLAGVEFNIGLLAGENYNKITNCNIINEKDTSDNLTIINVINAKSASENEYVSVLYNFGLVAGINSGIISNFNFDSCKVGLDKFSVDRNIIDGEEYNLGLITAKNNLDTDKIDNCKLSDITITNCDIKLNNFVETKTITENGYTYQETGDSIGLISAYSKVGLDNCTVVNSSVKNIGHDYLIGTISPTIYYVNKSFVKETTDESDVTVSETVRYKIFTAYLPTITNTVSNINFVNSTVLYAVSETYEKKETDNNGDEEDINDDGEISTIYTSDLIVSYDNGTNWSIAAESNGQSIEYFFMDYSIVTEENLQNADNRKVNAENYDFQETYKDYDNNNVNRNFKRIACTTLVDGVYDIQKSVAFNTNVSKNLLDAEGAIISDVKSSDYSQKINDNHYMTILKGGETLIPNIKNGEIYISTDVDDIQDLGLMVEYVVDGTQRADGSLMGTTFSGDDYFVIIDGVKYMLDTTINYTSSKTNGNYILNVQYTNVLKNIVVNSGTSLNDVLNAITSNSTGTIDINIELEEGETLNTLAENKVYTILYNFNEQSREYQSSLKIKVVLETIEETE